MKFASLFISSIVLSQVSFAQGDALTGKAFLQLSEAERHWWYEGAFMALGNSAGLSEEKVVSDCVWKWYFPDRARRKAQLLRLFKILCQSRNASSI